MTVVLRPEGDRWRVWRTNPPLFGAGNSVPEVNFSYEFGPDEVSITHAGGDALTGDDVSVRVDGERVGRAAFEDDETYLAGDTVTVEAPSGSWNGEEVAVVWTPGRSDAILSTGTAPEG